MSAAAAATEVGEEVIFVPTHVAEFPLGFVVDAGGSVTKLIYRSKEDYQDGKSKDPNSTQGKLRLKYFATQANETIIEFLQEHCDIMESSRYRPEEGGPVWFQTGVHTQHFKATLEKSLNIRTKMVSEMYGFASGLLFHISHQQMKSIPPSIKGVEKALKTVRTFISCIAKYKEFGEDMSKKILEKGLVDAAFLQNHAMKLMTTEAAALAAELGREEITLPCLLVVCGSAYVNILIEKDGSSSPIFFSQMSGKTFIGLGKALTGAKSFEELIAMADRGDVSKVNVLTGDLKTKEDREEDWYSAMPEDHMVFALGKLTIDPEEASYNNDDLAAGLLQIHCLNMAKFALLNSRLQKTKSVVFCGSFVDPPIAKELMAQYFLTDSIMEGFQGAEPVNIHFLTNPGFLCALGILSQNQEVGRKD